MKTIRTREVMRTLGISRVTLWKYVKNGKLKATRKDDKSPFDYDLEQVCAIRGRVKRRKVVVIFGLVPNEMMDKCRNLVQQFVEKRKDDDVEVYGNGDHIDCETFANLLDDITSFRVKELAVLVYDARTMMNLDMLRAIATTRLITIHVLGSNNNPRTSMNSLCYLAFQAMVSVLSQKVNDDEFRKKL